MLLEQFPWTKMELALLTRTILVEVSRSTRRRLGTKQQPNHTDGSFPKEKYDEKRARYSIHHEAEKASHGLQQDHKETNITKQRLLDSTGGGKEQDCQPYPEANKDGPVFVQAIQSIERETVNKGGFPGGEYSTNGNDQKDQSISDQHDFPDEVGKR